MFSVSLALIIFILTVPMAFADDSQGMGPTSGNCGRRVTWSLDSNGTLTISGTGTMSNYTSSSGTPWEARKSAIKRVAIESGVTSIGDCSFYGCSNLATVVMPEGLKTMGNNAFYNCDALVSITLPSGMTSVGDSAFSYCDTLTTVIFSNTVTSVGQHAFSDCDRLRNVTLSTSLESIGYEAFYSCDGLTSIILPDSVVSMESEVFQYCYNLRSIQLSNGLTSVPYRAFYNCSVTELTIPEGIDNIGGNAFSNNSISELTISEGLTSISSYAFSNNSRMETIHLPLSIETISSGAFDGCSGLTDVYYPGTQAQAEEILIGTNNTYLSAATWHFDSGSSGIEPPVDQTCGTNLTWNLSGAGILSISGTGEMTDYSVSNAPWSNKAQDIITVTISDGVTSIGSSAFSGCENLLVLNLPATVLRIGNNAFDGCIEVKVVNYSGTQTQKNSISVQTGNSSLISADWYCTDGDSSGMGATSGTCGRKLAWALSSDGTLTISGTGPMTNYTSESGKPWEARKNSIKTIVINEGVSSVGDYAFASCANLLNITLPKGFKTIGQYAFNNCDKLKAISVPSGVNISDYAFAGCDALGRVELASEVRSGYYSFSNCGNLTTLVLAEGVQSIGEGAFCDCDRLMSVTFPGSTEIIGISAFRNCNNLREVVIADGLENIGDYAFAECNMLQSIDLPDSVISLGVAAFGTYYNYNTGCMSLASIELSSSLTDIPSNCFYKSGLEEVTIPEGIICIGSGVFQNNNSLTAVYLPLTMEEIASNAFYGCGSLTDVYYAGTQAQAEEILIGTGNTNLTSVTWHCTEPPSPGPEPQNMILTLPSLLETIEEEAFAGVLAKEIIIPESVNIIESRAFADSPNLEMVYFEGSPLSIAPDFLGGSMDVTVSVLKGSSIEKYAKRWGLPIVYH